METDPKDAGTHDPSSGKGADDRISYSPRQDATPEGELAALAAVYAFVLQCSKQRQIAVEISDSEHETIERR
jgi:hypothetical protein